MNAPVDWLEEGKKHFVVSKIHPGRPPLNYPTQDVHSATDEANYCLGFRVAKSAWERGEGFSGLESYMAELEERKAARS